MIRMSITGTQEEQIGGFKVRTGSSVGEFILDMSSLKGLWNDQVENTSVKLSRKRRAWDLEAADNKGQGGDRQRQAIQGDRSTTQETTEQQQECRGS